MIFGGLNLKNYKFQLCNGIQSNPFLFCKHSSHAPAFVLDQKVWLTALDL